jgi:polysaccharide export outer membrane protein
MVIIFMKFVTLRWMTRIFPSRYGGKLGVAAIVLGAVLAGCQTQTRPIIKEINYDQPDAKTQTDVDSGTAQLSPETRGKSIASAINPAYRIGAEDVLHISVWKEQDLDREVLVRPDGGISFPLAGNLEAAGKTTQELTTELTRRIQRYIPEAVVTVTVTKVSGYDIFVVGKVQNPGQFTIGRYVDVLQALTLAGGLTPFASENNIKIQRRSKDGRVIVFPFEYSQVKKGNKLNQNIILQSGDTVVVP